MADVKINQLPNKTSLADTDVVIVESATQTMKMTVGKLKELLGIDGGGIVESGENANGRYVKFHDGTLICYKTLESSSSGDVTWTYPHAFVGVTISISGSILSTRTTNSLALFFTNRTSTSIDFRTPDNTGLTTQSVLLQAVGKWKF